MLQAIVNSFKFIVSRPKVLVPALIVSFINLAIFSIGMAFLEDPFFDVFYFGNYNFLNVFELVVFVTKDYLIEIFVFLLAMFVIGILSVVLALYYSKLAKKSTTSFKEVLSSWKLVVPLIFFILFIFIIFSTMFYLISGLLAFNIILGLVVTFLILILMFYVFLKLFFLIPIMAIEKKQVKDAILESWKCTNKKLFGILILMIAIFILNGILGIVSSQAISFIDPFVPIPEPNALFSLDLLLILPSLIFSSVMLAYSNIAIAYYYLQCKSKKA